VSKAAQWVAFGKNDVVKLRSSLEAHKTALEIGRCWRRNLFAYLDCFMIFS
jgi:hypothetical protein